jgi:hypothetical protein
VPVPLPDWRGGVVVQGQYHLPGILVGKIGDQKEHFVVGNHFEGKTGAKGRLYLWVVPSLEAQKKPSGVYRVEVAMGPKLADKAKNLVPLNNDFVVSMAPFQDKRTKLVNQLIGWKSALSNGKVPAKDRGQYEKAIQQNLDELDLLNKTMRKEFSHALYPGQWLERPTPEPHFGNIQMFR